MYIDTVLQTGLRWTQQAGANSGTTNTIPIELLTWHFIITILSVRPAFLPELYRAVKYTYENYLLYANCHSNPMELLTRKWKHNRESNIKKVSIRAMNLSSTSRASGSISLGLWGLDIFLRNRPHILKRKKILVHSSTNVLVFLTSCQASYLEIPRQLQAGL